MNIVNKLTIKHLKQNKRRTLVTMIGVIISVAMITAVASFGISFMDLMRRQYIADSGEWHVQYNSLDDEQLKAVSSDEDTKHVMLSRDLGYAFLENGKNSNKPYIFIKEYDQRGLDGFPLHITEGRLPQNQNELILSEQVASNGKVQYHLGDTITLNVGERYSSWNKENPAMWQNTPLLVTEQNKSIEELRANQKKQYTVVGFMKRPEWEATFAPGYTAISFLDANTISNTERFSASVVLKNIDRSLFEHAQSLAKDNGIAKIQFNDSLLRTYGVVRSDNMQSILNTLTAIIMLIIIVGSVSLIYNAFAISVSERSRYLGMLSSVGATKKQKRNSVFFEGAVIGLISIPIGVICGLAGIGITFACINPLVQGAFGVTEEFRLAVSPLMIIGAVLVSILTIFISTYLPARRASRITPIDAIRQSEDIKMTNRAVKTSWLTRKIFGIEADIGLKNLKRNKRRYKATVFSLIISIVLFLSVSYFSDNLTKAMSLTMDGYNFDIQISARNESAGSGVFDTLKQMDGVTKSAKTIRLNGVSTLSGNMIPEAVKTNPVYDANTDKFEYNVEIYGFDSETLQSYAQLVGADFTKLNDLENPSCIIIDQFKYADDAAGKYVDLKPVNLKKGDRIPLDYLNMKEDHNSSPFAEATVLQTTSEAPMGVMVGGNNATFYAIFSNEVLEQISAKLPKDSIRLSHSLFLQASDPLMLQQEIEEWKEATDPTAFSIFNIYQNRQQEEQITMLLAVFVYGFIILITAICIANILNTISTSIALRKREFAMLKSVGMTPEGFNKMINYESIFYGLKALLYGLPISILVMFAIYNTLMKSFQFGFIVPWIPVVCAVAAVFLIVGVAMLYSISKVKKENIIDALKQENI